MIDLVKSVYNNNGGPPSGEMILNLGGGGGMTGDIGFTIEASNDNDVVGDFIGDNWINNGDDGGVECDWTIASAIVIVVVGGGGVVDCGGGVVVIVVVCGLVLFVGSDVTVGGGSVLVVVSDVTVGG